MFSDCERASIHSIHDFHIPILLIWFISCVSSGIVPNRKPRKSAKNELKSNRVKLSVKSSARTIALYDYLFLAVRKRDWSHIEYFGHIYVTRVNPIIWLHLLFFTVWSVLISPRSGLKRCELQTWGQQFHKLRALYAGLWDWIFNSGALSYS